MSRAKAATPLWQRIGAWIPYLGLGDPKRRPCVSTMKYSIPALWSRRSSPGLYPHSGSQMPRGRRPKCFM